MAYPARPDPATVTAADWRTYVLAWIAEFRRVEQVNGHTEAYLAVLTALATLFDPGSDDLLAEAQAYADGLQEMVDEGQLNAAVITQALVNGAWLAAVATENGGGDPTPADDFNRADGALGANWTTVLGSPAVAGNVFKGGGGTVQHVALWNDTFGNDQVATFDPAGLFGGVVLRATGTGATFNALLVSTYNSGGPRILFTRFTNGVFQADTGNWSIAGTGMITVTLVGDTLTITQAGNGTPIAEVTGLPIATGAGMGAQAYDTGEIDNWTGSTAL